MRRTRNRFVHSFVSSFSITFFSQSHTQGTRTRHSVPCPLAAFKEWGGSVCVGIRCWFGACSGTQLLCTIASASMHAAHVWWAYACMALTLSSSSGRHDIQMAVMNSRLKAADPTMVPGPRSPACECTTHQPLAVARQVPSRASGPRVLLISVFRYARV